MERLNGYRMRIVLVAIVAAIVVGGGHVKADFTFGEPKNLGPTVNSTYKEVMSKISADGLSLYFYSLRPGGYGHFDIWVTRRATTKDDWGEPVNLGPIVNSPADDGCASISADGLELYFDSRRSGGFGMEDLWVATRATKHEAWGEPVNLGTEINTTQYDSTPSLSSDGLELYFARGQGWNTDMDIWLTTRTNVSDQWGSPVKLGPAVNGDASSVDCVPCISFDGLVLFFCSTRSGGSGSYDLWMSRRDTVVDPWGEAVNLGPTVNSGFWEADPGISADGRTLYFCDHGKPLPGGVGGGDLWQVSIEPIVDFNGDRIVDAEDMCIMVDHWGTDNQLCDIGPMPWGDGVVDVQDLIVLAEHLFEQLPGRPIEP